MRWTARNLYEKPNFAGNPNTEAGVRKIERRKLFRFELFAYHELYGVAT